MAERKRRRRKEGQRFSLPIALICITVFVFTVMEKTGVIQLTLPPERPKDTTAGELTGESQLEIHFLDVGQGDCTLIICDGQTMLIDAGDNSQGTAVRMYLMKQGITTIDYVIGTHPDSDHIGGLDVVLYNFDCNMILLPDASKDTQTYDDVIQTMENKYYKSIVPEQGATYTLGQASFTILSSSDIDYGDNANNASIALMLVHGTNKFLFTGDCEEEAEADMLRSGQELKADVYKVAHHGSKTASTEEFMQEVCPTYAVISCGEDNKYGHPHAEVLNRLRGMHVQLFRTDEQGAIIMKSDGKNITANCSPSESWQAGE